MWLKKYALWRVRCLAMAIACLPESFGSVHMKSTISTNIGERSWKRIRSSSQCVMLAGHYPDRAESLPSQTSRTCPNFFYLSMVAISHLFQSSHAIVHDTIADAIAKYRKYGASRISFGLVSASQPREHLDIDFCKLTIPFSTLRSRPLWSFPAVKISFLANQPRHPCIIIWYFVRRLFWMEGKRSRMSAIDCALRGGGPAKLVSHIQTSSEWLSGSPFAWARYAEEDAAKGVVAEVRAKIIKPFANQTKMMDFFERWKLQANLNRRFVRKVYNKNNDYIVEYFDLEAVGRIAGRNSVLIVFNIIASF